MMSEYDTHDAILHRIFKQTQGAIIGRILDRRGSYSFSFSLVQEKHGSNLPRNLCRFVHASFIIIIITVLD